MRVVTYSRVSTLHQETDGESLSNQARAFERWIERTGNDCVAAYREAASAGTIEGRAQFTRMLAEIEKLKVDAVVIDTLDRFTRSLRDGLNLIEELRARHVGLLPLDWRRDRPINLDDDRDWRDVVDEFTSAEGERRRIRRRVVRSYQGRRERGATTVNKTPFGVRRQGDRLVPDPETAWIIDEIDQRKLAGEGYHAIAAWARDVSQGRINSWSTIRGIAGNHNYVGAGVRSEATQVALDGIIAMDKQRFALKGKHDHELTGVFVCGFCLDLGHAPHDSIMIGFVTVNHLRKRSLVSVQCKHFEGGVRRHKRFSMNEHRILPTWREYVGKLARKLARPGIAERWAAAGDLRDGGRRAGLERSLAQVEQRSIALKGRRDRAFDLLGDQDEAVQRQARAMLREIDRDELEIRKSRESIRDDLRTAPKAQRDTQGLVAALQSHEAVYAEATAHERNQLNRLLCRAFGSHPQLRRDGHHTEPLVCWPEIDELLSLD